MERVVLPVDARVRWRSPALALLGALLLAGAMALGGGGALFAWALAGVLPWLARGLAVAALYLIPGLLLLRLLWPRDMALGLAHTAALALGVGLALPPLLLLLAQQVGLPWGAPATWAYLALAALLYGGLLLADRRAGRAAQIGPADAPELALLGISLAALLVRLYAVRDLPVGLLGDSYQHTLMAQLLVDHQGLFQSWQPYAPLTTFTYHFGFHANVAFFHYVTGADVPRSLVLAGQLINALATPLLYALAVSLGASRWAAVWVALTAGFLANTPAYFVNWGRYTQLTGQLVLIAAVVAWIALAESQKPSTKNQGPTAVRRDSWSWLLSSQPRLMLLAALLSAAMMLTHYLVTALAALCILSYLALLVLARRSWRLAGALALRALLVGALALLLALPWLLNVLRGQLLRNANGMVSGSSGRAVISQMSALEPVAPRYLSGYLLAGALLGLLVAGWRRDWRMALPALWAALMVAIVAPYLLGLPGAGVIDAVTGLGTLFIPVALLAGYALGWLHLVPGKLIASQNQEPQTKNQTDEVHRFRSFRRSVLGSQFHLLWQAAALLLMLALIARNTGWQTQIVTDETALVSQADLAAIEWIKANTPPDARFLVNSFPAYGGTLAAGTDAGWWLPLLAGRWASLPPLTYGSELGERVNYQKHLNNFIVALRGKPLRESAPIQVDLTRKGAWEALKSAGATYVYNGAHPYPGPEVADRFDSAALRASPLFQLVYDQGGVEIFQVMQ